MRRNHHRIWLTWWALLLCGNVALVVRARFDGDPYAALLSGVGVTIAVIGLLHRVYMTGRFPDHG